MDRLLHRAPRRPRRPRFLAHALALALLLGGGAGVAAARGPARIPSGNSAANQYLEVIPTAGGPSSVSAMLGAGGQGTAALPPATEQTLARQGQPGRAALALAGATAPPSARAPALRTRRRARARAQPAGRAGTGARSAVRAPSVSSQVASALTGSSGGLGPVLPAILGVTALAAVALWARRWRRRAT